MNFGGFLENTSIGSGGDGDVVGGARIVADIPYNNNTDMATGAIAQPMFNSPGLSLGLQTGMEGQGEAARVAESNSLTNNSAGGRRSREEEPESRSGSDKFEGASGDDQDAADKPPRKKRYHRHTPQQIQELEA